VGGRSEGSLTCIEGIDRCKCDKYCKMTPGSINSVDAKRNIIYDRREVLAAIDEMGKYILCIIITTNTLQRSPDTGKSREESKKPRMRRIALRGIVPMVCV
jgi:hypothetical protein